MLVWHRNNLKTAEEELLTICLLHQSHPIADTESMFQHDHITILLESPKEIPRAAIKGGGLSTAGVVESNTPWSIMLERARKAGCTKNLGEALNMQEKKFHSWKRISAWGRTFF